MSGETIEIRNLSKFYGEVLGVDRINVSIPPGITSLVGPNGSGKTTLLNLATGLLRPSKGEIVIRGIRVSDPERLFAIVGFCTQWDSFPAGISGRDLVVSGLRMHGFDRAEAREKGDAAIARVGMTEAADRPVAAYSKGMRQRIRLARAIAHDPEVLLLDEPLNGLDPMARAEVIELFRGWADQGRHVVVSSHILHEVDLISDRVLLLKGGYVIGEGEIHGVRTDLQSHPMQILVRCDRPAHLAARLFDEGDVTEVRLHDDLRGLELRTRDADRLFLALNRVILDSDLAVETVTPADDDVQAVYRYLIESDGEER
jgi:ABC-2 type transport system ATP-binding protein